MKYINKITGYIRTYFIIILLMYIEYLIFNYDYKTISWFYCIFMVLSNSVLTYIIEKYIICIKQI